MSLGFKERAPLFYLACLRIWTGWFFLTAGIGKLRGGFGAAQLGATLLGWAKAMPAWYRAELWHRVVAPGHLGLFAHLVVAGELGAGACLLLGLFVRPAALVALFLNLNFLFASGQPINGLMALADAAFLLAAAGRTLGADGLIRARRPRYLLG